MSDWRRVVGVWRAVWRELRLLVAEGLIQVALGVHPMDRPEVRRVILDAVRRYAALQLKINQGRGRPW